MDVCVGHFEAQNNRCYPITAAKCLDFLCNLLGEENHTLKRIVVKVVEVVNLLLWHNKCMALCERIDVEKGEETIVLCHFVARNLPCYDS